MTEEYYPAVKMNNLVTCKNMNAAQQCNCGRMENELPNIMYSMVLLLVLKVAQKGVP